jgi:alanine racemase
LGLTFISKLVIESGIDFLAVSKLQEAVSLRRNIAPDKDIRIMVFDTPMLHDLSTYAANQIETIIPSSRDASSVDILASWLKNKSRLFGSPLKTHIMIDTGMRRNGGYSHNLPASVLSTITALERLDKTQIQFAGLATHLACYRCTDYKGEEIVNFRSLQLQRLQHVITYLVSHGVHLPIIHIGGGLGLFAEQWPKEFQHLDIPLYTRVGHGIYGMEREKDLHPDCPKLHPVVEMNFQVCNVFYVEEEEPVSYGGLWRAPPGGAWIATLAGGWAEGVPRTSHTLGEWEHGMMISINDCQYPVVGNINMNAMMVNLGLKTTVKVGDRGIIFGWRSHEPSLNDLAQLSGQIGPSIMVNVPTSMPRIVVSE